MKVKNNSFRVLKLLDIAVRAQSLGLHAAQEPQIYLVNGRLARDPKDVRAHSETIIDAAKAGGPFASIITELPMGTILLQCAMRQVSMYLWDDMWNSTHPEQFGQAWMGEDFELMSVWRERVRTIIKECRREALLVMNIEDYFNHLTAAGGSEEIAETLAEWMSEIHVGYTRST